MEKMITCTSCGAEISENAAKCPFCGSAYYKGSEIEYMGKLEDVRENMEDLADAPMEEFRKSAKRQSKKWLKLFIVIALIAGGLTVLYLLVSKSVFDNNTDYRAQYAWKEENFPKLDALYDAGQYDEMVTLYDKLARDKNASLYEWEHYDFYHDYTGMQELLVLLREAEEKKMDKYGLYEMFYLEWSIKFIEYHKPYNELELAALKEGMDAGNADFETRWHMSDVEYEAYYAKMQKSSDAISMYSGCKEYVDKWMKENR